jgi:hypothetical protein
MPLAGKAQLQRFRKGLLFLKKKKQKDFRSLFFVWQCRGKTPSEEVFWFFFQKRTASLTCSLPSP